MAAAAPDYGFRKLTLDEVNSKATDEGRYSHVGLLGQGTFGSTFLSVDKKNKDRDRQVAMKAISVGERSRGFGRMAPGYHQSIEEGKMLGDLRHGNIVGYETVYFSFFGEKIEEAFICTVTEYFVAGSLDSYLRKEGRPPQETIMKFCRQIAIGVEHLHSKKLTHQNIKPDNILLDGAQNIKIADFGIANVAWQMNVARSSSGTTLGGYLSSLEGTSAFVAPEVLDNPYTTAADVFSVGLVYVAIVDPERFTFPMEFREAMVMPVFTATGGGHEPLGRLLRNSQDKQHIPASNLLGIDSKSRPSLTKLLDSMLLYDHEQRPSIADVSTKLEEMDSAPLPETLDTTANQKAEVKKRSCCPWFSR